jgi:hypothetical protein
VSTLKNTKAIISEVSKRTDMFEEGQYGSKASEMGYQRYPKATILSLVKPITDCDSQNIQKLHELPLQGRTNLNEVI